MFKIIVTGNCPTKKLPFGEFIKEFHGSFISRKSDKNTTPLNIINLITQLFF